MLAVWKSTAGLLIGVGVLLALGVLFFVAAKLYKRKRLNQEK
jgi:ABC-type Na+ efflux pump permease subunit